jgi:hypothetical protein
MGSMTAVSIAVSAFRTFAAFSLCAGALSAQQTYLTASLDGAQATPPNTSPATGSACLVLDQTAHTVTFHITFANLTAAETAAHFHQGSVGVPGPVTFALPLGSPKTGTLPTTVAQETAFLAGNVYIDIHSVAQPGGEIRGQVVRAVGSTCPPAGPPFQIQLYRLEGAADGTTWSWELVSTAGWSMGACDVTPVFSGDAYDVALQFAQDIDSTGCPTTQLLATATQATGGIGFLKIRAGDPSGSTPFTLSVGADCCAIDCVVPFSPAVGCTINPTIAEIPRSGQDCNGNQEDDAFDIALGTSTDVNTNGVPDECEAFLPYCPGDGSAIACPCGNNGAAGGGCANSMFPSGGRLSAAGTPSVSADTAVLAATSLTGSIAVFFQGETQTSATIIDDGIGCVGGPIIRLGTKAVAAAASSFPQAGDLSISVRGAIPPAGGTRYYQCFYRNAVAVFCPPATSNRTNGVRAVWAP